ncbi:hypothetical protein [Flavobacterium koreense]
MKKLLSLMLLFFIFQIIFSCASKSLPNSESFKFDSSSKNGLLIGTITFIDQKPSYNGYFLRLTDYNRDEISIPVNGLTPKHSGQLDNGRTYLFMIERAEGKYDIPFIRVFSNSGIQAFQSKGFVRGFSIPYNIEKGKISYLGNIIFDDRIANQNPDSGDVIKIKDELFRDVETFKKYYPSINFDSIKSGSFKLDYITKKPKY